MHSRDDGRQFGPDVTGPGVTGSGVTGPGAVDSGAADPGAAGPGAMDPDVLGVERFGERATLVQFSSAFCQPCRATRRILHEVAGMVDGVLHVEIDAEARLDLVRTLRIAGTPTVLVLDAGGRTVRRASGQPRKADVIAALGRAVQGAGDPPSPRRDAE